MTLPISQLCTCKSECENGLRQSRENNNHGSNIELFLSLKLFFQHLTKGYFPFSRLHSTACSKNNQEGNGDDLNEEREKIVDESRDLIVG